MDTEAHPEPTVAHAGSGDVPEPTTVQFDTDDGRLARAGVSLTRRDSGEDAGWHLAVPIDNGLHQVRVALTRSTVVPLRLRRLTMGWTRGSALVPRDQSEETVPDVERRLRRPKPGRPARLLLHVRLAEQVDELLLRDCDVRLNLPDGVRRFRVACRRLRAAMSTFADLLDMETAAHVRAELQWLARALGAARDAEVARERVRELLDHETPLGPVRRRCDQSYRARAHEVRAETLEVLSSARYVALLDSLDHLVEAPTWSEAAELPAKTLTRYVHSDWRRVRSRVRRLEAAREVGPTEADLALHDVRRSIKRLRYAVETLEPVADKRVRDVARRAHDVTRVLGDLQDTVIVRQDLVAISSTAAAAGENAFTYGRLHLGEELHADHLQGEFDRVWRRLEKTVSKAGLKRS